MKNPKRYIPANLEKVKTYSVKKRETMVHTSFFTHPQKKGASFKNFYSSLPNFLAANSLRNVVEAIVIAHKAKRPVVIAMGAHVIKVGLAPFIIELMKKGIVKCVVLNGAGAIHDFEIATLGKTSEDVGEGLEMGMFGMVEETMRDMNQALTNNKQLTTNNKGMGELLGIKLNSMKALHRDFSVLTNGVNLGIPVTVHVAIGSDTIHMSPYVDPKALGEASFTDFRLLCSVLRDLEGGVYLNIGSAVILPEVFLKALNVARNLGNKVRTFTAVNMDMLQHYRPFQNVLSRPGGRAYSLTGHHEIMVPLLYQAIIESLG